jgi:hypothetical protein
MHLFIMSQPHAPVPRTRIPLSRWLAQSPISHYEQVSHLACGDDHH